MKLRVRLIVLALLTLVNIGSLLYVRSEVSQVSEVRSLAREASNALASTTVIFSPEESGRTLDLVVEVESELKLLQERLDKYRFLVHLPFLGVYLRDSFGSLEAFSHLIQGGRLALEAYVQVLEADGTIVPLAKDRAGLTPLKERLVSVRGQLLLAKEELQEAHLLREKLSRPLPIVRNYLNQFDSALPVLESYLDLALDSPALLEDFISIQEAFGELSEFSRQSAVQTFTSNQLDEAHAALSSLEVSIVRLKGTPEERLRLGVKLASAYRGEVSKDIDISYVLDNAILLARSGRLVVEGLIPLAQLGNPSGTLCETLREAHRISLAVNDKFRLALLELDQFDPQVMEGLGAAQLLSGDEEVSTFAGGYTRRLWALAVLGQEGPDLLGRLEALRCGSLYETFTHLASNPMTGLLGGLNSKVALEGPVKNLEGLADSLARTKSSVEDLGFGGIFSRLEELIEALTQVTLGVKDIQEATIESSLFGPAFGDKFGAALEVAQQGLSRAPGDLALLNESVGEKGLEASWPIFSSLNRESETFTDVLRRGREGLDLVSYLLGYESPRTILLLGQDENEIRATGGFIGGVAEFKFDKGVLAGLRVLDGWEVDGYPFKAGPLPPAPLYKYMWNAVWFFHDTNWSPHFPSSAETVAYSYWEAQGIRPDVVVANDRWFIEKLIDALGGADLPELPDPLPGREAVLYFDKSVPGRAETYIYPCKARHGSSNSDVCFTMDLIDFLLSRLSSLTQEERPPIGKLVTKAFGEKHLLIASLDEGIGGVIRDQGWDGAVKRISGDYVMVVDSNLGINKGNRSVERSIHSLVSLRPFDGIYVDLDISYENFYPREGRSCDQGKPWCYWNYLRVYIPDGATRSLLGCSRKY